MAYGWWLAIAKDLTPADYSLIHTPRRGRRGGGIGLLHKATLKVKKSALPAFTSFECSEASFAHRARYYSCINLSPPIVICERVPGRI